VGAEGEIIVAPAYGKRKNEPCYGLIRHSLTRFETRNYFPVGELNESNPMNRKYLIVLRACCVVVSSSPVLAGDNPVVGEWVAATTTKGGLGGTRTFDTNGSVVIAFGAAVHFKYKLETNSIVMTGPEGTSQRVAFVITNDTLRLGEAKEQLTRARGTEGQGLVGKWAGKHYTGGQQVMDFTTNMNCYLSVPFESVTGSFAIKGNTVTEKFKDQENTWNWKIANGILTLTEISGGKTEKYQRKE